MDFLKISNHEELANFLDMTYGDLSKLIYGEKSNARYKSFSIKKKNGSERLIKSPVPRLKVIQHKIKCELDKIYIAKPSVYGFLSGKSIRLNAEKHLDKKYILNIDLENFFGTIHFGRVRNLFKSKPFNFNHAVATILAQICCFENSLPQGSPASPVISNMICLKLDSQLQALARDARATYTRYADDITFSFTSSISRISRSVFSYEEGAIIVGEKLTDIITKNGFKIKYDKVRVCHSSVRMEVTGLTINEFPNVRRSYVRKIRTMLYFWKKYGRDSVDEYCFKVDKNRHAGTDRKKSIESVLQGKLAFLRDIRGIRSPIFNKLALKFNSLSLENFKFKLHKKSEPEKNAIDSLWVIEFCYDKLGDVIAGQGTGFMLDGVGLVTCAHVVSEGGQKFKNIEVFKPEEIGKKFELKVDFIDVHRDFAICSIFEGDKIISDGASIPLSHRQALPKDVVTLLGFPAYKMGQTPFISDAKVATIYPQSGVSKFEIDRQIREGNSGGPVIFDDGSLAGIALEGAKKDEGNNAVLASSEIQKILDEINTKTSP